MHAFTKSCTAALLFAALLSTGCSRAAAPSPEAAAPPPMAAAHEAPRPGSLREVRVALDVRVASETASDAIRGLTELARSSGGYAQLVQDRRGEGRSHVILRVPPASLAGVRAACARAGEVASDEETATDVTDAIVDVDARLGAARIEESRLLALVEQRTGSVADVLAAERALADVRDRIERTDAESRAAHARVELAVVDIWLTRSVDASPSVVARLKGAANDGVRGAGEVSLALATTALRFGPTLGFFGAIAGVAYLFARRVRRAATRSID